MSTTGGSFALIPTAKNLAAFHAFAGSVPAAGTAQTVTPAEAANSVTAHNYSNFWLRATLTVAAGVTADATAAQMVQLVPPQGTETVDLTPYGSNASGQITPITSIKLDVIVLPAATTEASAIAALTTVTGGAPFALNFAAK